LEIKKLAKTGNADATKVLAKEIIRIRNQKTKLLDMKVKLSAQHTQVTSMKALNTISNSMSSSTKVMTQMNNQVSLPKMQQTSMEFQKQSDMMGMTEDMFDELFDDETEEGEADEVLAKVYDEMGLEIAGKLSSVPKQTLTVEEDEQLDAMIKRLVPDLAK